MQDTFLHEVYHSIVHVMDLKETETEENYVCRLATGLCTFWKNNPAAFKWWSGLAIKELVAIRLDSEYRLVSRRAKSQTK